MGPVETLEVGASHGEACGPGQEGFRFIQKELEKGDGEIAGCCYGLANVASVQKATHFSRPVPAIPGQATSPLRTDHGGESG